MKKQLALAMVFVLVAGIIGAVPPVFAAEEITAQNALQYAISNSSPGALTVIEISDDIEITGEPIRIYGGRNIALITTVPSGVTISRTAGSDRHFIVGENSYLSLGTRYGENNISVTRPYGTEGIGGGVLVQAGGRFTMYGGKISGNTAAPFGGGVEVSGNHASFIMHGGTISGNHAPYGGGVRITGGNSTFNMYGGAITGNTSRFGGGAEVRGTGGNFGVPVNAAFNMHGGTISDNTAEIQGGGIIIANAIFNMYDGEINFNSAHEAGGVFALVRSTFVMSGGAVHDNICRVPANVARDSGSTTIYSGVNLVAVRGGVGATGTGFHAEGREVTVFAGEPPSGKQFANWCFNTPVDFANNSSPTDNPATFIMPNRNVVVTAFEPCICPCPNCNEHDCICELVITFNAGRGSFRANGKYTRYRDISYGESIGELYRMTAMSHPYGYRFLGWFEDIYDYSTRWKPNGRVSRNRTLFAKWVSVPADFSVGDVTRDRRTTSSDATAMARFLVSTHGNNFCIIQLQALELEDFCVIAADIDGDGKITIADLILLRRWLVGHNVQHQIAK
ncbi:MAG: hypothetical protein FWB96_01020 [Defluviitaleaceae bacterium]|nr:hypothetical protein [Defluviitaleaceae bacterium]MCL2262384.1 hypothetical protein [Defluviitaleaceae bacterium]